MAERDPLMQQVQDLFRAFETEGGGFKGLFSTSNTSAASVEPQRLLPASTEIQISPVEQEHFEEQRLLAFFHGRVVRGIRVDAQLLHDDFEEKKRNALALDMPEKTRRIWENTTLESMAKTAEKRFEEAQRASGTALPDSPAQKTAKFKMDKWASMSAVARAAAEIEKQ